MPRNLAVPFYHMTLHLDPALVGLVMAIPRIWDALTDPIVGHWSDRTRSRFGRRRPFMVVGAVTSAVAFAAMWWVPADWGEESQLLWLLMTSLLFYTCHNLWSIPYLGLGYELSDDYHGRTRIMAAHGYFLKVAELISHWIFPLTQLVVFSSTVTGMRVVTVGVAVVVFAGLGLVPALGTRERMQAGGSARAVLSPGFSRSIKMVFQSRPFRLVLALTLAKVAVGMFANTLEYYLLVYYVFDGDLVQGSLWNAVLMSVSALLGMGLVRPVVRFSERHGKIRTLAFTYVLLGIAGVMRWFVFRPDAGGWLLVDAVLCAPVWITTAILFPSLTADICDEDELRHGERREGLFGAVGLWLQQGFAAVVVYLSGDVLNRVGFDVALGGRQAEATILWLRLLMVGVTVGVAVISLVLLRHYPLGEKEARATTAALRLRRAAAKSSS